MCCRGDWVCSLCRNVAQPEVDYDCENERTSGEQTLGQGLSACDQRVGRIMLNTTSQNNSNDAALKNKSQI